MTKPVNYEACAFHTACSHFVEKPVFIHSFTLLSQCNTEERILFSIFYHFGIWSNMLVHCKYICIYSIWI